ncbi:MAG: hypothetical protein ABH803_01700, partial [Candidatus Micrarchaeota archaeon]
MKDAKKALVLLLILIALANTINAICIPVANCASAGPGDEGCYILTRSVAALTGTCFNITTNNVWIDCNNYYVNNATNEGGYGFWTNATSNISIRNCVINNFTVGVARENT